MQYYQLISSQHRIFPHHPVRPYFEDRTFSDPSKLGRPREETERQRRVEGTE